MPSSTSSPITATTSPKRELASQCDVRTQLSYLANPRALIRAGRVFLPAPAPTADGAAPGPLVSVRATTVVTKAPEFTDGSGWPCRSRHRISWRSRRSLPQNVPLSYTGTTGGPIKIIADTNGCMDLPPNPIKSRDGQDPVPILVAGLLARSDLEAGIEALLRSWPGTGLSSNGTGQWR